MFELGRIHSSIRTGSPFSRAMDDEPPLFERLGGHETIEAIVTWPSEQCAPRVIWGLPRR